MRGKHASYSGYFRTVGPDVLRQAIEGKSVAIVGNAVSLTRSKQANQIDACDIVIRLNRLPGWTAPTHGVKTDWIAVSKLPTEDRIRQFDPQFLLWMTTKKRWRALWLRLHGWKLYSYDTAIWQELVGKLGARPSTGLMIIDLVVRLGGFRKIKVFGFDFFDSGSLSGRAADAYVPHDYSQERQFVEGLIRSGIPLEIVPPASA